MNTIYAKNTIRNKLNEKKVKTIASCVKKIKRQKKNSTVCLRGQETTGGK